MLAGVGPFVVRGFFAVAVRLLQGSSRDGVKLFALLVLESRTISRRSP